MSNPILSASRSMWGSSESQEKGGKLPANIMDVITAAATTVTMKAITSTADASGGRAFNRMPS